MIFLFSSKQFTLMVTPSSIFSQYKQKQPASKLRWLFLWYFYSAIFCGFWCILTLGFMLQNTTFIKITISKTTAIATQNPISIPKNSVVSNRFIQILPSSSKSPPFKAALHSDVHTPFQAGCKHHIKQDTWNQICKIRNRKCYKSQHCPKWCKWNDGERGNTA